MNDKKPVDARDLQLARFGFVECKDCLYWVHATKAAVAFHYRRCKG